MINRRHPISPRIDSQPIAYVGASLALCVPSAALALGGEAIAESLLKAGLFFIAWIVATILTFFIKTKPWSIGRYFAWLIRLSLPAIIAWGVFVSPYLAKQNALHYNQLEREARHAFAAMCKEHEPKATRVIRVTESARPNGILVEEPDELFGPEVSLSLANCITRQESPACAQLGFEYSEWAWLHSPENAPCKNGKPDQQLARCPPEFKRYDLAYDPGGVDFRASDIDRPLSQYVLRVTRVDANRNSARISDIRRYEVKLQSRDSGDVLATSILLMSSRRNQRPCPEPGNEAAKMISLVFPNQN